FVAVPAIAGPNLTDDVTTCRDRQNDVRLRQDACERVISSGQAQSKDLAVALTVRAEGLANRDFDKAIATFADAIKADPENYRIAVTRGWAYQQKGQDNNAMADYNLVLSKRPNFAMAFNDRGTLYLRKGALQSAYDDFSAAIKNAPNVVVAYTTRARVETATRDYTAALADFAAAEKIDPNAPQIAANRCVTYAAMGKFDEAIADCNRAIEKAPKSSFALDNRADAYLAKGNLDAALKDYNAVLAMYPNNVPAHTGRGIALLIGNGAYKNVHALDNPPRDAKLVADSLKGLGFQTVTLANDLTRDKFFETLRSFATEAEKADWAVVYYAGHGFEIGGVNYLVPVDARLAA